MSLASPVFLLGLPGGRGMASRMYTPKFLSTFPGPDSPLFPPLNDLIARINDLLGSASLLTPFSVKYVAVALVWSGSFGLVLCHWIRGDPQVVWSGSFGPKGS